MTLRHDLQQLLQTPGRINNVSDAVNSLTPLLDKINRSTVEAKDHLQSVTALAGGIDTLRSSMIQQNQAITDLSKCVHDVFQLAPNNPFLASTIDQVNYLHTALFGYPLDAHTDANFLLHSMTVHEIALKILNSPRFQNEIRAKVPLWPNDRWVQTTLHDLAIWINLKDSFIAVSILQGHYEEELVALMMANAPENGTVVDVGANVGAYTLQAARAVGNNGRVYAFEPRPDTYRMLAKSVAANGFEERCVVFRKGLSDKPGQASMHDVDSHNPGASFVREGPPPEPGMDSIELTALDELDFGSRVDFFKIDVEGFESKVLKGGREFFLRYQPPATSEVFPNMLREAGGSSAEEYLDLWESYGYEVRLFDYVGSKRVLKASELRDEAAFPGLFNIVCHPRSRL